MRRTMLAALVVTGTTGCLSHTVKFEKLDPAPASYVVDKTKPDSYPGFMVAEGNIYSCRYGIHHQSREEFDPPKAVVFAKLLARSVPGVTSRKVALQRFDVYYNHRIKALSVAGAAIGGVIGAGIRSSAAAAAELGGPFVFQNLVIDPDPLRKQDPDERWIGCDDEHEGEYSPKEVGGGNVVVTWLQFTVDGAPYHFRSFFPVQHEKAGDVEAGIASAVSLTIEGIAPRVSVVTTSSPSAPSGTGASVAGSMTSTSK